MDSGANNQEITFHSQLTAWAELGNKEFIPSSELFDFSLIFESAVLMTFKRLSYAATSLNSLRSKILVFEREYDDHCNINRCNEIIEQYTPNKSSEQFVELYLQTIQINFQEEQNLSRTSMQYIRDFCIKTFPQTTAYEPPYDQRDFEGLNAYHRRNNLLEGQKNAEVRFAESLNKFDLKTLNKKEGFYKGILAYELAIAESFEQPPSLYLSCHLFRQNVLLMTPPFFNNLDTGVSDNKADNEDTVNELCDKYEIDHLRSTLSVYSSSLKQCMENTGMNKTQKADFQRLIGACYNLLGYENGRMV